MVGFLVNSILLGIGLAMDAFAVSICKGLSMKKIDYKKCTIVGIYFGLFQALMPLLGFYLGSTFKDLITSFDHWIAFGLLVLIGANMIRESFGKDESSNDRVDFKTMLPLAIATSIDALAIGVTFSFLEVNIFRSIIIIGITTFVFSFVGVIIGNLFGSKYKKRAEIFGGIILILLGIKILLEHLGVFTL